MAKINKEPTTFGEIRHGDYFYDDGIRYKVSGRPKIIGTKIEFQAFTMSGDAVDFEANILTELPKTRKASKC